MAPIQNRARCTAVAARDLVASSAEVHHGTYRSTPSTSATLLRCSRYFLVLSVSPDKLLVLLPFDASLCLCLRATGPLDAPTASARSSPPTPPCSRVGPPGEAEGIRPATAPTGVDFGSFQATPRPPKKYIPTVLFLQIDSGQPTPIKDPKKKNAQTVPPPPPYPPPPPRPPHPTASLLS